MTTQTNTLIQALTALRALSEAGMAMAVDTAETPERGAIASDAADDLQDLWQDALDAVAAGKTEAALEALNGAARIASEWGDDSDEREAIGLLSDPDVTDDDDDENLIHEGLSAEEIADALLTPDDYTDTVERLRRGETTAEKEASDAVESAAHAGIRVTEGAAGKLQRLLACRSWSSVRVSAVSAERLESTVDEAIAESTLHDSIVTLRPDTEDAEALCDVLLVLCDDGAENLDVREFWADDWRVHVVMPGSDK